MKIGFLFFFPLYTLTQLMKKCETYVVLFIFSLKYHPFLLISRVESQPFFLNTMILTDMETVWMDDIMMMDRIFLSDSSDRLIKNMNE